MNDILWYVGAFLVIASIVGGLVWCINKFFDDFMGR